MGSIVYINKIFSNISGRQQASALPVISSINIKEGLSTLSTAALLVYGFVQNWNFSRIFSMRT
jgi:hypothetical protein